VEGKTTAAEETFGSGGGKVDFTYAFDLEKTSVG
jgi:hypothetical protein